MPSRDHGDRTLDPLYKSEGEKVMLQFSNTSEPFRLEFEMIDE